MSRYYGQKGFQGFHPTREFYSFDANMPLSMFSGAANFTAEYDGQKVSFTIGPDITIQPEGSDEATSIAGKRGIISTTHLKALVDNMIPAVLGGTPDKVHRHHKITPEEALAMQGEFQTALGMADIAQANAADQKADFQQSRHL